MIEDLYATLPRRKRVCTQLRWSESAYAQWNIHWGIRWFVWTEARIYATSVKWKCVCKLGFAEAKGMKYLICSAVFLLSDLCWYVSVDDVCLCLKVWKGFSLEIWWIVACKLCSIEVVGSSVKIDETWSKVVLRVVAFSQGVVAPFQVRLVNEIRGS